MNITNYQKLSILFELKRVIFSQGQKLEKEEIPNFFEALDIITKKQNKLIEEESKKDSPLESYNNNKKAENANRLKLKHNRQNFELIIRIVLGELKKGEDQKTRLVISTIN